eukprot:TCONS_00059046-protein
MKSYLLLVASILTASIYSQQILRLPQCDKFGATFKVSKRKIIGLDTEGLIIEHSGVYQKERCSSLCIEEETCESAFYHIELQKCKLYSKTFDEESELVETDGVLYMTSDDSLGDDLHGHACVNNKCNITGTDFCEETCDQPDGYYCHCRYDHDGTFCDERLICAFQSWELDTEKWNQFNSVTATSLTIDECQERCFEEYKNGLVTHIFYKNETHALTTFPTRCLCYNGVVSGGSTREGHFGCEMTLL